ncbi:MAG: aldolase/citrate lyase family protein [Dehalococcoidia bacterium]
MIKNCLRPKLGEGRPVVGCFVNVESPAIVEILGLCGVEFVVVDAEHNPILAHDSINYYRAAESAGIPAITRIGENSQQVIAKYMDVGCAGVMMPMVNSAEDAKRVVDAVKYPPMGTRGLAGVRAAGYGLDGPLAAHVEQANENSTVVVQIETMQAVERADEIIATEGVDVVFLGPTDLSVALGVHGQTRHPKVLETIEALTKKINAAGKMAGTIARDAQDYAYWRDRGMGFFLTGASNLLAAGAKEYVESIKAVEEGR